MLKMRIVSVNVKNLLLTKVFRKVDSLHFLKNYLFEGQLKIFIAFLCSFLGFYFLKIVFKRSYPSSWVDSPTFTLIYNTSALPLMKKYNDNTYNLMTLCVVFCFHLIIFSNFCENDSTRNA